MSYTGQRLAPLFDRGSIDRVCRELADHAGDRVLYWTRINTPIGHRPFDEFYVPGQLRASIEKKLLVVYPSRGGLVYESGAESNLSYAGFVEEGTGLYGKYRRMYVIRPKNPDGWLRFHDEHGNVVFAKEVHHPGIHGQHMFAIGVHMTEFEFGLFSERILHTWVRRLERAYETQPPIHVGRRL